MAGWLETIAPRQFVVRGCEEQYPMTRTATWFFLAMASALEAFAQVISDQSAKETPFSGGVFVSGVPSGPNGESPGVSSSGVVNFEGLLARSDGSTLSIELPDQRVIRFQLNQWTRYSPESPPGRLAAFRITDVVSGEAEAKNQGYFLARSVRFVRKPSPAEQSEILQCPEVAYRWEENVIDGAPVDPDRDSRKLSLVAKPNAILEIAEGKPALG